MTTVRIDSAERRIRQLMYRRALEFFNTSTPFTMAIRLAQAKRLQREQAPKENK